MTVAFASRDAEFRTGRTGEGTGTEVRRAGSSCQADTVRPAGGETEVKVAFSVTPLATIAPPEPELIVLLLAPVVTLIVPPPLALNPVPLVVVIASPRC